MWLRKMTRKLSQVPATNLSENIGGIDKPHKIRVGKSFVLSNSLKALDALSDDRISNSPCLDGRNNGLLHEVCSACNKTPLDQECSVCGRLQDPTPSPQAVPMYTEASLRNRLAGIPHPVYDRRAWLELQCGDDHLIPATARQVNDGAFWCRDCDRPLRVCPHGEGIRTKTTHDIRRSGNAKQVTA